MCSIVLHCWPCNCWNYLCSSWCVCHHHRHRHHHSRSSVNFQSVIGVSLCLLTLNAPWASRWETAARCFDETARRRGRGRGSRWTMKSNAIRWIDFIDELASAQFINRAPDTVFDTALIPLTRNTASNFLLIELLSGSLFHCLDGGMPNHTGACNIRTCGRINGVDFREEKALTRCVTNFAYLCLSEKTILT